MNKKTAIIIVVAIFLVVSLAAYLNETKINEKIENNAEEKEEDKETNATNNTDEERKDDDVMDGITLNYQSSIRIEKDGKIIYFDPYKIESNSNDADYIFITHSHYDHYSEDDIKKIMKNDTKFVVTSDLENKVKALGVLEDNVLVVYPNEEHNIDDISFETVPAYNIDKTYHKKSYNWVGYVIDLDGVKYYDVGDSDVTDEFKNVSCDVIFVPVGGTYTMTDSEAASAVNEMKPKYAVPVHYGEVGSSANADNFANNLNDDITGVILK